MSYRIHYQSVGKNRWKEHFPFRRAVLTVMFFGLFLFLVCNVWTDSANVVKNALASLRPTVVVSLMDDLAEVFQNGGKLTTAVACFVERLTSEAYFASN